MYCIKCGKENSDNQEYCINCGANLKTGLRAGETVLVNNNIDTNNQSIIKKESFLKKNKKKIIFTSLFVVLIVIAIILYSVLYGFKKISWNEKYEDYNLEFIMPSKVKLGLTLSDISQLKDIKIETSCGKFERNGLEIIWNLSDCLGENKIDVSYRLRKISKKYTVIADNNLQPELSIKNSIDYDSDEDLDSDNLTNKEEKEYKTNPELSDSDLDGLDDYYEIFTSKTDPNKKDTDGDTISDFDELELGLDSLKVDSKEDGVKDSERELTYSVESENSKLEIIGKGNIASTTLETIQNTKISNKNGFIDVLYNLYTDGNLKEASFTISYTNEELEQYGLNEDNLTIYNYDPKTSKYEKVDTIIDKDNKTVTAKLKHFSYYVLGDKSIAKESSTNQILFILDNSWSMYSLEQIKKYTEKTVSSENIGYDPDGLRFTLTSSLVSRLSSKGHQIGLSEFREDYASAYPIGSDAEDIKDQLTKMTGSFITSKAGTNISNALLNGIKEFSKDADNKYIILLTDGVDDSLSKYMSDIVANANANNVKICSVGFGGGTYNNNLSNISDSTGCKFFASGDAMGLSELFDDIGTELDDDLVDIEGDGKSDGLLVADSGFIVNRDGFSFANYGTNLEPGGHCYGMATFVELYYLKQLPMVLESKYINTVQIVGSPVLSDKSYAYDLKGSYFDGYTNNLYDYKLKTNNLKYQFTFNYFDEEQPKDLRKVKDGIFAYTDKYKEIIEKDGLFDIVSKVYNGKETKEEKIKKWGAEFNAYEDVQLNEDRMQESDIIDNEDKQLFNAIYASFIKQDQTADISTGLDAKELIQKMLNLYSNLSNSELAMFYNMPGSPGILISNYPEKSVVNHNIFMDVLKYRINSGDVPVMEARFNGGGFHAVNAISLVQDTEDANHYYIGVYDNNHPGEKRYVDLQCSNIGCIIKANEYYKGEGEIISISESLEEDFKYFNIDYDKYLESLAE